MKQGKKRVEGSQDTLVTHTLLFIEKSEKVPFTVFYSLCFLHNVRAVDLLQT